jgi:hypothetical protein
LGVSRDGHEEQGNEDRALLWPITPHAPAHRGAKQKGRNKLLPPEVDADARN